MTGAWVWENITIENDFLPNSYEFAACILLDYSHAVQIIEEYFTSALTTINVNLVIDYAATMTISCVRNITDLVTFMPTQKLILIRIDLRCVRQSRSIISQIKL